VQGSGAAGGAAVCPFCLLPLAGGEVHVDEDGVTGHAECHDMDRSANGGDWISREYDLG
jgi:hypothetical protein